MKKSIKTVAFAAVAITALSLSSCGKYEEGPGFTVLTKKARITGVWDAKEYVSSNGNAVADTDEATVEFTKSGSAILSTNDPSFPISITGTWEFSSDNAKLKTTYGNSISEETILRLTNSELWLKDSDGDIVKYEKK